MIKNKYIIETNTDGYVIGCYVTDNEKFDFYGQMAQYPNACNGYCKFVKDDSEAKGHFEIDEVKKAEIEKAEQEKIEHDDAVNEQLNRIAEMCVEQGVNADDYLSRIDAQTLYTAMMTDTVIEGEM